MNSSSKLDEEQKLQQNQYNFPYHYIPEVDDRGRFSQTRQWSWGYRYLGGIQVVLDRLSDLNFNSLIDIGCGDGRFLHELKNTMVNVDLKGIDYSHQAIDFANAMNPDIEFECKNIINSETNKQYDIVTLIEVLEHIPPDRLSSFLDSCTDTVSDDGCLIITVPHKNKPVQKKHYQHFSRKDLTDLLSGYSDQLSFFPFDKQSRILSFVQRLLGGQGNHYVITSKSIKAAFWEAYKSKYLYTSEPRCGRIAVVCHL